MIILYVIIIFIIYYINKKYSLKTVILRITHKCITNDNRIIEQIFSINNNKIINKYNLLYGNIKYFVSSSLIIHLDRFYIINELEDYEICNYNVWNKIKSGNVYILKYDTEKIIIDVEEFTLKKYLDKYLLDDIIHIIVNYYV